MKLFLVTIALLAVTTVGFVLYRTMFRRSETVFGFMDYVRNPTMAFSLKDEFEMRDAEVAALAKRSPHRLVEMLLQEPDQFGTPTRAICEAGPQVVPALLAAINDPRFREPPPIDTSGVGRLPIAGVLSCLEELAPPEAGPAVLPLVTDDNKNIRKEVALLLGSMATDDAAPSLCRLLDDEDDYVRSYAMLGILRALKAERGSETFRRLTFDAMAPLVYRRAVSGYDQAPECLLRLDKARAVSFLTSSKRLGANQQNLHEVLRALRLAGVKVAETDLLKILADWKEKAAEYPGYRVVGQTLMMLATVDPSKSIDVIDPWLTHPSDEIREEATAAKVLAMGVENPIGFAWDRLETVGWEGLTDPQRHVVAVKMMIAEVENGGFFQYFLNSSGDQWRDAADGLIAIGATGDKDLFDQALKLFGTDPPSEDSDERHEQVSEIAKLEEYPFSFVEGPFYEDKDNREVLLLIYILNNADDFR